MTTEIQELTLHGGSEEERIHQQTEIGVSPFSVKPMCYSSNVQIRLSTMVNIEIMSGRRLIKGRFNPYGEAEIYQHLGESQNAYIYAEISKCMGRWQKKAFIRMFEIWGKADTDMFERGFMASRKFMRSIAGFLGTFNNSGLHHSAPDSSLWVVKNWPQFASHNTRYDHIRWLGGKGVEACREFARQQAKGKAA